MEKEDGISKEKGQAWHHGAVLREKARKIPQRSECPARAWTKSVVSCTGLSVGKNGWVYPVLTGLKLVGSGGSHLLLRPSINPIIPPFAGDLGK